MRLPKSITIIGGGLAGLTLGIGLRRRGVPATIWEAGGYPRHRVCGEFISGRGQMVLERLGLWSEAGTSRRVLCATALFICGKNRSPIRRLGTPALCVSRYMLDALLAETFEQLGGDLRATRAGPVEDADEGMVQAGGRRAASGGAVATLVWRQSARAASGSRLPWKPIWKCTFRRTAT